MSPTLGWNDVRHALGVPRMDATHREFLTLVGETIRAGQEDFPLLFEALTEHTRDHFEDEGELMRVCNFPAIREHEGEHRRIIRDMERFLDGIYEGRTALARAFVRESLPEWFNNHLATMDAALAAQLKSPAEDR